MFSSKYGDNNFNFVFLQFDCKFQYSFTVYNFNNKLFNHRFADLFADNKFVAMQISHFKLLINQLKAFSYLLYGNLIHLVAFQKHAKN